MIKAKPSIPRIQLTLFIMNQELVSINWKCVTVESKKNTKHEQIFNIISDQNKPKFCINTYCVLFTKARKKQPNKGKKIIKDNIKILN